MLYKLQNLRARRFAEAFLYFYPQHTGEIDAPADNSVALLHLARHTLAGQSHGIQARTALENRAVKRYLFTSFHHHGFPNLHVVGCNNRHLAAAFHAGRVRTDVHHSLNGVAALVLGIVLEQLAHLEKQHDKYCLGELWLGPGQETDAQRTYGCYAHQEVFVERVALPDALFHGFAHDVVADNEVRHQINAKLRPQRKRCGFYKKVGQHQGNGRKKNSEQQFFIHIRVDVLLSVGKVTALFLQLGCKAMARRLRRGVRGTAAVVRSSDGRRTGFTTAAIHACGGRRTTDRSLASAQICLINLPALHCFLPILPPSEAGFQTGIKR